MKIENIGLSNRIVYLLKRNEIVTIEQLLDIKNNKEFRLTPCVEAEIEKVLSLHELKFNDYIESDIEKLKLGTREQNLLFRITIKLNKKLSDLTLDDLVNFKGCGEDTAHKLYEKINNSKK